jgi:uncharacterized lipoprotein YddW (UPF0748 family)
MAAKKIDRREFVCGTVASALVLKTATTSPQDVLAATVLGASESEDQHSRPVAIVRSDFSKAEPATALTRNFQRDHWQLVDYETVDGIRGMMVWAKPEDDCPTLTLPLDAVGPHKIFLGINYTSTHYLGWPSSGQIDLKLSSDEGFRRVAAETGSVDEHGQPKFPEGQELFKSIQETYWKTADLTGKSLMIRQPQAPYRRLKEANLANLCYVKLIPLSNAAQAQWRNSTPAATTRRLAAIYCTGQLSGATSGTPTFHPKRKQWFVDEFEAYKRSDVGVFIFDALRGNYCVYRSKFGDVGSDNNCWNEEWADPLAEFTELAHRDGMKILASMRMIGPQYPMNRAPIARARHYWRMAQFTKRDRDGTTVSNLSIAYPEVRQYWLSLLRETLAYGVDGVHLHLNRSVPFVLYEEPVTREFKIKYNEDPRKLLAQDPRWIAHAAGFLTTFVREVRKLLDETPGRQLGVTVFGPTRELTHNDVFKLKSQACDVDTWLKERLVDYVIPSKSIDLDVLQRWHRIGGDRVHLWPDLMPRFQTPASYAKLARKYLDAGADGFSLWDSDVRHPHISEWSAIRQLGHVDQWDRMMTESPNVYRIVKLRTLGGFSVRDSFRDG